MNIGKSILICGNGPSLKNGLLNKNLYDFDYVLRMNNWKPIEGHNNRCDIWCTTFWHDVSDNTIINNKNYIIWDMFLYGGGYGFSRERKSHVMHLLKKNPEFYLSKKTFDYFRNYIIGISSPSCGMYAIFSAMIQQLNISICGFDYFGAKHHHYFEDKEFEGPHKGNKEKQFVQHLINQNLVAIL